MPSARTLLARESSISGAHNPIFRTFRLPFLDGTPNRRLRTLVNNGNRGTRRFVNESVLLNAQDLEDPDHGQIHDSVLFRRRDVVYARTCSSASGDCKTKPCYYLSSGAREGTVMVVEIRYRLQSVATAFIVTAVFITVGSLQAAAQDSGQDRAPGAKPAASRGRVVATEGNTQSDTAGLEDVLRKLVKEVHDLTAEVRQLRRAGERNTNLMETLLYEERLARVEDNIQVATQRKSELDAQEQTLQSRKNNIQMELILRGSLHREEAEAAIRAELAAAEQNLRAAQSANQKRLSDLQAESGRIQARIEELRKKMDAETNKDQDQSPGN